MKNITILGSTGSIGKQAIEVCEKLNIRILGLSAKNNVELLAQQVIKIFPKIVCVFNEDKVDELKQKIGNIDVKIVTGIEGLCEVAKINGADICLNAVVGIAGLKPTLAAIKAKKTIALANKETLVTGGKLVIESAIKNNVKILPVDSEHSAIFQSLQGTEKRYLKSIILTASGGPFFGKTKNQLENVTIEQALNHPNWSMGKKITIDSATMMNKGLEIIEACHLFGVMPKDIQVVIHKESVIHSLVEFKDNAVIAQLGTPDMKVPIQYALTYPERKPCDVKRLSLVEYASLSFAKPDMETFDCLSACVTAMNLGGLYPALINGANEKAVELFLNGEISFLEIGRLVMNSINDVVLDLELTVENIFKIDKQAREYVQSHYKKR